MTEPERKIAAHRIIQRFKDQREMKEYLFALKYRMTND